MNKFFTNFLSAFVIFIAFVVLITGIAFGPIMFVVWLGVPPLPYGLPIAFLIWGIIIGFWYAVHECLKWSEK